LKNSKTLLTNEKTRESQKKKKKKKDKTTRKLEGKKEKERGREEHGDKLHTSSVTHKGEEGSHDRDGENISQGRIIHLKDRT